MEIFHKSSTSIRQQEEDEEGKNKIFASYRKRFTPMGEHNRIQDHRQ